MPLIYFFKFIATLLTNCIKNQDISFITFSSLFLQGSPLLSKYIKPMNCISFDVFNFLYMYLLEHKPEQESFCKIYSIFFPFCNPAHFHAIPCLIYWSLRFPFLHPYSVDRCITEKHTQKRVLYQNCDILSLLYWNYIWDRYFVCQTCLYSKDCF